MQRLNLRVFPFVGQGLAPRRPAPWRPEHSVRATAWSLPDAAAGIAFTLPRCFNVGHRPPDLESTRSANRQNLEDLELGFPSSSVRFTLVHEPSVKIFAVTRASVVFTAVSLLFACGSGQSSVPGSAGAAGSTSSSAGQGGDSPGPVAGAANPGGGASGELGGAPAAAGATMMAGGAPPENGGAAGTGNTSASCTAPTTGHYQMEDLDRGVVAVKVAGGDYVGWRMFGYEYDKPAQRLLQRLPRRHQARGRHRQHELPGRRRHRDVDLSVRPVIGGVRATTRPLRRRGPRNTCASR